MKYPPPLSSGTNGLDDVLGSGFPSIRFFLVNGEPGAGKTTLALKFLLEGVGARGKGLYITLPETCEELLSVADLHGWSLDGLAFFELSSISDQLAVESQNTLFPPAEVELKRTTQLLLDEVERLKSARVVPDSLAELRILSQNSLRYRRQILALEQFFQKHRSTVLLLDDRSATDMWQVKGIAHGVLNLEVQQMEYGVERRRLHVLKLRVAKFPSGYHDYVIKTGGLEVFPRLIAAKHLPRFAGGSVATGISELDQMMGGGLDRGSANLFLGPAVRPVSEHGSLRAANPAFSHRSCGTVAVWPSPRSPIPVSRPLPRTAP